MKIKTSVLLLCIAASLSPAFSASNWSYEGQQSPEHWAELSKEFHTCHEGKYQSPVNITHVVHGHLPDLHIDFHTDTETIVNNDHTIMVTVRDNDHFLLDDKKFILKQFHFHAPSENHINGKAWPLEAHFVHADDNNELAVIAVMFKEGKENPGLTDLIAAFPSEKDHPEVFKQGVDLRKLLPSEKRYYRLSGSLTTPPCTEGVRWLVMKQPVTLSAEQLKAFKEALQHPNNRPIQDLHGRMVVD
ncbi:carbonic anhydrase [Erwinia psidii]|uniref:carbonic anhydrase n=1 Tax=Erwinia psidii TaxID=69224 RepID=A0A3N6UN01_9GAMM|nr:carbonic anhydrase family protein [Erwinia psidii]RQM37309.1 carbonic anhydrase family protein [Erwinia psidii]